MRNLFDFWRLRIYWMQKVRPSGHKIHILHSIPLAKTATRIGFGYNFVREGANLSLLPKLFPNKTEGEVLNVFPTNWKLEHIGVSCGFFSSLEAARKGGWTGDIPDGFTERKYKRFWQGVWIWK